MNELLITISEFSNLSGLSRKALLIYEEMGLLLPKTRSEKNYRKYSKSQISTANEITALKGLGFSLEEIKRIFILKGGEKESIKGLVLYATPIVSPGKYNFVDFNNELLKPNG